MMPPGERLQADQVTGGQLYHWLVMDFEIALPQGFSQVLSQLQPVFGLCRKSGIEDATSGSPPRFGVVHGGIGITQQGVRVGLERRGGGDADTGRNVVHTSGDLNGVLEHRREPLGN
jgi:hypothetical protein